MADALHIDTVTAAIAALSVQAQVNGADIALTILDADEVPQGLLGRNCPFLAPPPDMGNFLTDFNVDGESIDSSSYEVSYKLNYLLVYQQVGAGRNTVFEHYAGMLKTIFRIAEAVCGVKDEEETYWIEMGTPFNFVVMEDDMVSFYTCQIPILVTETIA